MKNMKLIAMTVISVFVVSCAVISNQVRQESLPDMPFKTLIQKAGELQGKTVILGGYIIETRNLENESKIWVLQTPLSLGESPDYKDRSEGRFVITHQGFLDPEIFRPDRRITVAGVITGLEKDVGKNCPFNCLVIRNREIHLWPDYPPYPYPYYDPFYYPYGYPYYGYPYDYPFHGSFWLHYHD